MSNAMTKGSLAKRSNFSWHPFADDAEARQLSGTAVPFDSRWVRVGHLLKEHLAVLNMTLCMTIGPTASAVHTNETPSAPTPNPSCLNSALCLNELRGCNLPS